MKGFFFIAACAVAMALVSRAQAMSCSVGTSGIQFGSYDVLNGSPLNSAGSISYSCDAVGGGDTIIIELSRGASANYLPRTLIQGAYQLEYNLYLDAARTRVWGDGSSGTQRFGPFSPVNGVLTEVPLYGRILGGQNVHAGTYSDTVVVTVVF